MSLRVRLLIVAVLLAATYAVAAVVIVRSQQTLMIDQIDDQLSVLPPIAQPRPGPRPVDEIQNENGPDEETTYSEIYMGRVAADGTTAVLFAGSLLSGSPDIAAAVEETEGAAGITTIGSTDSRQRFRARVVPEPSGGWLVSTRSLSHVDEAIAGLRRTLIIGGVVAMAVLGLAMFWVQRLGLRPIADVTRAAEAITAGDRSLRVKVGRSGTEAAKLSESFNFMLDERDAAETRVRQFVADASHELRTPLTTIRGYLALYERGAFENDAQINDAMRRLGAESERMSALVEDLLALASLDEGRPLSIEAVEMGRLLHDAGMDAGAIQPARPITIDAPKREPVVFGDRALLAQLVGILVSNALAHTPVSAAISLSAAVKGSNAVISVADRGRGLEPEAAAKVFDRFWRAEEGRSRARTPGVGGRSGLGLAIARSIVEAHGGVITLESATGVGSVFTVTLPLGNDPALDGESSDSPVA